MLTKNGVVVSEFFSPFTILVVIGIGAMIISVVAGSFADLIFTTTAFTTAGVVVAMAESKKVRMIPVLICSILMIAGLVIIVYR